MLENLSQYSGWGIYALQFALGVIFIVHGLPKLGNNKVSPFGIGGLLHGAVEALGGLAMIANFYSQFAALAFIVIMLGAIYFKQFKWKTTFTAKNSTGWEFDFLILAASLVILLN